jgi:hypothetical protein
LCIKFAAFAREPFSFSVVYLSPDVIRPSPENDLLYRPVRLDDPEILKLAQSIRDIGLQEPLTLTREGYILSGHRRYAACLVAGLKKIPCRCSEKSRLDPDFEAHLVACNSQRVKSFDEVVRERIVEHDPKQAYDELISHRAKKAKAAGKFFEITGRKTRAEISAGKQEMLDASIKIIEGLEDYWPISVRTVHYELLNDPPIRCRNKDGSIRKNSRRYGNDTDCYSDLVELLARARLFGLVPFDAISDETRTIETWGLSPNVGSFVGKQLNDFLSGYWRDLQASQPNHVEILVEKLTVEGSIKDVAARYTIPYTVGRGYCSIDPKRKMVERFRASGKSKLIILIISDFDPDGEEICMSFARSIRDDFGLDDVQAMKVCLTLEQTKQFKLENWVQAKKPRAKKDGSTDTEAQNKYNRFVLKAGNDHAFELEALPPAVRANLLDEAIRSVIDIEAFNHELEAEARDAAKLKGLREAVKPLLTKALNEGGAA